MRSYINKKPTWKHQQIWLISSLTHIFHKSHNITDIHFILEEAEIQLSP